MIAARLQSLGRQLEVAGARARALPTSIRFGYIGGQGDRNLGDDAMFEVAQRLLPRAALLPYSFPAQERRLARVGLSGPRYFDAAILGGGTFINPYAVGPVELALRQGLPLFTLGTGVGSGGFGMAKVPALDPWLTLLHEFRGLGVRGPRSKGALDALGVERVEVVGDLALAFALPAPAEPSRERPRFAVNLTLPPETEPHAWSAATLIPALVQAIRRLEQRGLEPVLVGMHLHDRAPLEQLAAALGRPELPRHFPETAEAFLALVGPCAFTLCVRLHAAVLSSCAGVPSLSLGYREKCLDFMESVDLADWHLALDRATPGEIEERALALAEVAPGLRSPLHGRVRSYRDRLRAYLEALRPGEVGN